MMYQYNRKKYKKNPKLNLIQGQESDNTFINFVFVRDKYQSIVLVEF